MSTTEPRPAPSKDSTPVTDADTRERLMRQAMRMLASQGMNGVSLRSIVRASGAANPSALHYHFGDRRTLIADIAARLQEWYEARALPRLEALGAVPRYTVRDVLEAVFGPTIEMLEDPDLGVDAVRFIARLGWDFGHEGQAIASTFHRRALMAMVERLQPKLPEIPIDDLHFKVIANLNNVYNGLAYRSYLWRSPFGASPLMQRDQAPHLRELLMSYIEGGLTSPARPVG